MTNGDLFSLNLKLMQQHERYSYEDIEKKTAGTLSAGRVKKLEKGEAKPTTQELNTLAELFHFLPTLFRKKEGNNELRLKSCGN